VAERREGITDLRGDGLMKKHEKVGKGMDGEELEERGDL